MYYEAPGKGKMLWGAIILMLNALLVAAAFGFAVVLTMSEMIGIAGAKGFFVMLPGALVMLGIPGFWLVACILGIVRARKPEKCKICKVLGMIMLIAGIALAGYMIFQILQTVGRINLGVIIVASGAVIWPWMFYAGASENWAFAKEQQQEEEARAAREAAGLPPRPFPFNR